MCLKGTLPPIIGTTGFTDDELAEFEAGPVTAGEAGEERLYPISSIGALALRRPLMWWPAHA